jgi:hypothetical protein
MREGVGESGARGDFQDQFRQIDARQQRNDLFPQRDHRSRFLHLVQRAEHQFGLVVDRVEPNGRVVGQPSRDRAIGTIQFLRQRVQGRRGARRQPQCPADDGSGAFPLRTIEQPRTRIGVAPTGRDEHITPAQGALQFVQYAEGVGVGVHAAILVQNMALPGFADNFARRIVRRLLPAQVGA